MKETRVTHTSGGCTEEAIVQEDGTVAVNALSGYNTHVETLLELQDNGNGYYVKFPSFSSTIPHHILNLDYSEIEYIWLAYKALRKYEKVKLKEKK